MKYSSYANCFSGWHYCYLIVLLCLIVIATEAQNTWCTHTRSNVLVDSEPYYYNGYTFTNHLTFKYSRYCRGNSRQALFTRLLGNTVMARIIEGYNYNHDTKTLIEMLDDP